MPRPSQCAALLIVTLACTAILQPVSGFAQELAPQLDAGAPEGAVPTAHRDRPFDRYALPVGPYTSSGPDARFIEGRVIWSGFKIEATDLSTAEIIAGYRSRLASLGYQPIFECDTVSCGGFDFRFAIQLLPPPTMAIDTADFVQYSASRRDETGAETFASVLASRLLGVIHIQTVVVAPSAPGVIVTSAPVPSGTAQSIVLTQDEASLMTQLEQFGHVPVRGLIFETGGAKLSDGSTPALETMAQLLNENPDLSFAIVGHSDNQGSLENNIALSKRRAEAVRTALAERGVDATRLEAHGVGYLLPVSTNSTEEGRTLNRRVELVLR